MKFAQVKAGIFEELRPYFDTAMVPVGSMTFHGPHLPFGTGSFIAETIATQLEDQFSGRILAFPAIAFGHPFHSFEPDGSAGMHNHIFRDYLYDSLTQLKHLGIKYVVLVNGHKGNADVLRAVTERLAKEELTVLVSHWWMEYQDSIENQDSDEKIAPNADSGIENETSVMLAIRSELVDLQAESGNPAAANAKHGEKILRLIQQKLADRITAMWTEQ
ncbi:creatininase family protein [Fodinisporobacter ferrooxydans]|uniref:Creatininase family protein n=1 Tax=Fodinisporobacter ferrooxydans TaxID=2901836 RepID=A0ABY4CKD3_9BACL|nr:creatininase family protein [Alicyclobacillaceae bacterium MYW30-H2]